MKLQFGKTINVNHIEQNAKRGKGRGAGGGGEQARELDIIQLK